MVPSYDSLGPSVFSNGHSLDSTFRERRYVATEFTDVRRVSYDGEHLSLSDTVPKKSNEIMATVSWKNLLIADKHSVGHHYIADTIFGGPFYGTKVINFGGTKEVLFKYKEI